MVDTTPCPDSVKSVGLPGDEFITDSPPCTDMAAEDILFRFFIAFLGAAFGLVAVLMLDRMEDSEAKAMVSFQLHPEETINDFRLLLIANSIILMSMFIYTYGAVVNKGYLLGLSSYVAMLFGSIVTVVFYRWQSRF